MPKHTRLHCRNGTYYHRAKVPTDIVGTYGKREELISLRTKNVVDALRLVKIVAVQVDEKFEVHRREQRLLNPVDVLDAQDYDDLSPESISALEDEHFSSLLQCDEKQRWNGFEKKSDWSLFPSFSHEQLVEAGGRKADLMTTALEQMENMNRIHLSDLKKQVATGQFDSYQPLKSKSSSDMDNLQHHFYLARQQDGINVTADADALLARHGVRVDKQSDTYRQLLNAIARAKIKALESVQSRNVGDYVDTPKAEPVRISDSENPKLSKAVRRWLKKNQRISQNQRDKKNIWYQEFITAFGDRRISDYLMKDARAYVDALDSLPKRYQSLKGYKRLNIVEAADKGKEDGLAPISAYYANKKIEGLRALWRFLMVEYDETVQKNIFMDRKIERDKKTVAAEKLKAVPFTTDELQQIFNAPIYTGMKRKSLPYTKGTLVLRDERFWIPLILLMHGSRPNEICQLYKDDIRVHEGILFMRIAETYSDQRVKNDPSHRVVPIHDELLKCGFKSFVDAAPDGKLFPNLKIQESTGRYSDSFAKSFGRFLVRAGVKDPDIKGLHVPYSFRHGWQDAARVAHDDPDKKMDMYARRRLFGHVVEAGEGDTYGTQYDERRVPALKRELDKIEFVSLDLSHLYTE